MRCSVWYAGQLLGTTALEFPSVGPGFRGGVLEPSEAFAEAWGEIGPVFREMHEVTHALLDDPQLMAEMRPDPSLSRDELGRRVHQAVVAHPLSQQLLEAHARATALPFEIRDADGRVIPFSRVVIQEVAPPEFIPPGAIQQAIADAAESGIQLSWPSYVIALVESPHGQS